MTGLSERQRRTIEALLVEPTLTAAATRAGVSERTLRRWFKHEQFREAYSAAGRERLSDTVTRLRAAAGEAVEALRSALADDHAANRIRAAQILLEQGLKVEVDELADRVAALENAEKGRKRT